MYGLLLIGVFIYACSLKKQPHRIRSRLRWCTCSGRCRVRAPWHWRGRAHLTRTAELTSRGGDRVDATRSQTVAAPAVRWDASWHRRPSSSLTAHAYHASSDSHRSTSPIGVHGLIWPCVVIGTERQAGGLAVSVYRGLPGWYGPSPT